MAEVLYRENDTENRFIYNSFLSVFRKLCGQNKPTFIINPHIEEKKAIQAAGIQYRLDRENVRLEKYTKTAEDVLHDKLVRTLVMNVLDLQEEYDDQFHLMIADKMFPVNENIRRCVFRTLNDEDAEIFLTLLQLYNKWTTQSAEYLISYARRDHDIDKLRKLISVADQDNRKKLEDAQKSVAKEYGQRLIKQRRLLMSYVHKLHTLTMQLNDQCSVLSLLSNISEHS